MNNTIFRSLLFAALIASVTGKFICTQWIFNHTRWNLTSTFIRTVSVHDMPRIRTTNVSRSNERKSGRYHAETIIGADYVDDILLLANASAVTDPLPHSLEQATRGMGLYVNSYKQISCFT